MKMTIDSPRSLLVTAALPYANGDLHLGNLMEYVQADFWVRFQRMKGHRCLYFCADDAHGTPIMVKARQDNRTPEELIEEKQRAHMRDFAALEIEFTHYSSTNTEINRSFCEEVFSAMERSGKLFSKVTQQLYSEQDKMFLPDRFVKGTCPLCGAKGQYGDSCDACGGTYAATEVMEPRSVLSGDVPTVKETEHLFWDLEPMRSFLEGWIPQHTSQEVTNKMNEWLQKPLKPWNISRDAPYFGFRIPKTHAKYFYVWVDAPLGYLATTKEWCQQTNASFEDYWGQNATTEVIHFIGKDIVYFHTLFFPAMLRVAGYRLPDKVFVHGFLTLNGKKMSKSKGTFIPTQAYLQAGDATSLRYYYACKVGSGIEDVDLNLTDLVNRVNSDLVGKITNLASRSLSLLHKHFGSELMNHSLEGTALWQQGMEMAKRVGILYEAREFPKAQVLLREFAEVTNRYIDAKEPWRVVLNNPSFAHRVLSDVLHAFRIIAICLKPILPSYAKKVEALYQEDSFTWESIPKALGGRRLLPYESLARRLDGVRVDALLGGD